MRYGSTRYNFFSDELPEKAEELLPLLRKFPAGAEILCHIDPASPLEAVIDRNVPWHYFVRGIAVLAGMLFGMGLFAYAVRLRRRERPTRSEVIQTADKRDTLP